MLRTCVNSLKYATDAIPRTIMLLNATPPKLTRKTRSTIYAIPAHYQAGSQTKKYTRALAITIAYKSRVNEKIGHHTLPHLTKNDTSSE